MAKKFIWFFFIIHISILLISTLGETRLGVLTDKIFYQKWKMFAPPPSEFIYVSFTCNGEPKRIEIREQSFLGLNRLLNLNLERDYQYEILSRAAKSIGRIKKSCKNNTDCISQKTKSSPWWINFSFMLESYCPGKVYKDIQIWSSIREYRINRVFTKNELIYEL